MSKKKNRKGSRRNLLFFFFFFLSYEKFTRHPESSPRSPAPSARLVFGSLGSGIGGAALNASSVYYARREGRLLAPFSSLSLSLFVYVSLCLLSSLCASYSVSIYILLFSLFSPFFRSHSRSPTLPPPSPPPPCPHTRPRVVACVLR